MSIQKKVLITGASGFIGGFLAEEAVRRGYQVYAGIRSSSETGYLNKKEVRMFTMDLSNTSRMIRDFQEMARQGVRFQYVIHNAGVTKAVRKEDFMTVNCRYTQNLAEALLESQCLPEKFLYMSSLEAYGHGDENTGAPVRESDKPQPFSLYGKSKLKAEQYLSSLSGFPWLILRPTGVYGPRERDYYVYLKAVNRGFEFYIGRKKQYLSFVYVRDLARLVFLALESSILNRSYFVTDGYTYTSEEVAGIVKRILGKKCLRLVVPKSMVRWIAEVAEPVSGLLHRQTVLNRDKYRALTCTNWRCDASGIREDFDFRPEYDLETGMRETIAWYRAHRWL